MNRWLLFICTGNYYRSRFAEIFFNSHASKFGLSWKAISRGIAVNPNSSNVGPIANETIAGLKARGIELVDPVRFPIQLRAQDIMAADLVIALQKSEHRHYLEKHFPDWVNKFEYWHIQDIEFVSASEALLQIEREVYALVQRFSSLSPESGSSADD